MKFRAKLFSSLYILLLCASVSDNLFAAQTEKPERWFEIEVILFKQLGDKKALKEQFPENVSSTNLPKYKKHFDLLTPYLQPRLTNIKQFIPLCSKNDGSEHDTQYSLPQINTPFSDVIKAIGHVDSFDMAEFSTENEQRIQQGYKATGITQNSINLKSIDLKSIDLKSNGTSLALEQQVAFVFDLQEKELASPLFSAQNICIISRKDLENIFDDNQLANFQLDAFDVEALPTKLNASGEHISNNPYLIADESLLLTDIKQRLRWSKEFKPLLHFGWRQVGITRNKAIPLKLFAGKHLDYQYQQALNDYQHELDKAILEYPLVRQQLTMAKSQKNDSATIQTEQEEQSKTNYYTKIKQQQLTQLFHNINAIDSESINNLIAELERQTLEELIAINEVSMDDTEQLNIKKPPIAPLQPWFLDGFFKVHLDHYLYITADFNVLSQTLDKNTRDGTNKMNVKLINFSQNKRVISGEIHYFDHPYIGMIVQIRRFDPSKPKADAITQVIN